MMMSTKMRIADPTETMATAQRDTADIRLSASLLTDLTITTRSTTVPDESEASHDDIETMTIGMDTTMVTVGEIVGMVRTE